MVASHCDSVEMGENNVASTFRWTSVGGNGCWSSLGPLRLSGDASRKATEQAMGYKVGGVDKEL